MVSPSRFFSPEPPDLSLGFVHFPLGSTRPGSLVLCVDNPNHPRNATQKGSCASILDGRFLLRLAEVYYVDECKISIHF